MERVFLSYKKFSIKTQSIYFRALPKLYHFKKEVDKFLIGVDSLSELKMIISFLKKGHEIKEDMKHLSCSEENLINPTKWPKNNK